MTSTYELGKALAKQSAEDEPMSICLMAYPDGPSLKRIQNLKKTIDTKDMSPQPDDGTDGPHVTLRYWNSKDLAPKRVKNYLRKFLSKGKAITTKAIDWEIMGKDDMLTMRLDSPKLMDIQEELDKGLQERGVPASTYPEYKPHVSMFENATEEPEEKPDLKIRFNKWILSTRESERMDKSAYEIGLAMGKAAKADSERKKCPEGQYWDGERCQRRHRGAFHQGFGRFRDVSGTVQNGAGNGGMGNGMMGGGNGGANGGM